MYSDLSPVPVISTVWCRSARSGLHKVAKEVLLRVRVRARLVLGLGSR